MAVLNHLKDAGTTLPNNRSGRAFTIPFTIDTEKVNVTSGDIVRLLDIPANIEILKVIANVTTAEGGTLTLDFGDYLIADNAAVDADGFLDGINGNAAASYASSTETMTLTEGAPNTAAFSPAYARGKYYRAATAYLGVLFNNTADAAIIDVHVICLNCKY